MDLLRLSAPGDLETAPLICGLDRPPWNELVSLDVTTDPRSAAAALDRGDLDAALLPSHLVAERARRLEIVPGLAVTSRGACGTAVLWHRRPLRELRVVKSLSPGHSGEMLIKLLFAASGHALEIEPSQPENVSVCGAPEADALLAAGTPARLLDPEAPESNGIRLGPEWERLDLGAAWKELVALPFVWHLWAARPGCIDRQIYGMLHSARTLGRRRGEDLAAEFENQHGGNRAKLLDVLNSRLRYRLGNNELAGLRRFWEEGRRWRLFPAPGPPRLVPLSGSSPCGRERQ